MNGKRGCPAPPRKHGQPRQHEAQTSTVGRRSQRHAELAGPRAGRQAPLSGPGRRGGGPTRKKPPFRRGDRKGGGGPGGVWGELGENQAAKAPAVHPRTKARTSGTGTGSTGEILTPLRQSRTTRPGYPASRKAASSFHSSHAGGRGRNMFKGFAMMLQGLAGGWNPGGLMFQASGRNSNCACGST